MMKSKAEKILAIAFVICFFGIMIAIFCVLRNSELRWIALALIGVLFFVVGAFLFAVSLIQKDKGTAVRGGILACVAFLFTALFAAGRLGLAFGSCETAAQTKTVFPIVLTLVGSCGLIGVFLWNRRFSNKFSTPVEAMCIDEGGPVFRFTLNGEQHTLTRKTKPKGDHPTVGEVRTLYIDENDLGNYYDPKADKHNRTYLRVFLSIIFCMLIFIGAAVFLSGR